MNHPPCIEIASLPIPHARQDTTLTIDKRCYVNRHNDDVEKRVRISIFKKDSRSVELDLDDAIFIFERGIELAKALKTADFK